MLTLLIVGYGFFGYSTSLTLDRIGGWAMGVFGGAVETQTRKHGGATDNAPINFGSLDPKAMTSPTALAGTTGTEASLIHGDSWNQMAGNQTENILGWQHFTVSGDEVHKILSNLKYRVNGTTNDTRVGVHNQTNISPRNDEFLHTRTEIHHQKEVRIQKTEDVDWGEKLTEFRKDHFEGNWLKLTILLGPEIAINGVLAYEAKALGVANKVIAAENVVLDCEIHEIGTAISIVAEQIKATVLKVSAAHLKAIGFNGNTGIAVNGDSPLG